jgi:hypothetical protein
LGAVVLVVGWGWRATVVAGVSGTIVVGVLVTVAEGEMGAGCGLSESTT